MPAVEAVEAWKSMGWLPTDCSSQSASTWLAVAAIGTQDMVSHVRRAAFQAVERAASAVVEPTSPWMELMLPLCPVATESCQHDASPAVRAAAVAACAAMGSLCAQHALGVPLRTGSSSTPSSAAAVPTEQAQSSWMCSRACTGAVIHAASSDPIAFVRQAAVRALATLAAPSATPYALDLSAAVAHAILDRSAHQRLDQLPGPVSATRGPASQRAQAAAVAAAAGLTLIDGVEAAIPTDMPEAHHLLAEAAAAGSLVGRRGAVERAALDEADASAGATAAAALGEAWRRGSSGIAAATASARIAALGKAPALEAAPGGARCPGVTAADAEPAAGLWPRIEDWIGELQRLACALDSGPPRRRPTAPALARAPPRADGPTRLRQLCRTDTQVTQALCAWWAALHLLHRCLRPRRSASALVSGAVADLFRVEMEPDAPARVWARRFLLLASVALAIADSDANPLGHTGAGSWQGQQVHRTRQEVLQEVAGAVRDETGAERTGAWWVALSAAVLDGRGAESLAADLFPVLASGALALPPDVPSPHQRLSLVVHGGTDLRDGPAAAPGKRCRESPPGVPASGVIVAGGTGIDGDPSHRRLGRVIPAHGAASLDTAAAVATRILAGREAAASRVWRMPLAEQLRPQGAAGGASGVGSAAWPRDAADRGAFVGDALLGRAVVLWQP